MNAFDVVVVGGGPAGAAAAFTAASHGLRVCLVDKSLFPRDKLCGGLLTGRSMIAFQQIFAKPLEESLALACDDIRFYSDKKCLAEMRGYSTLHFTMRREFDAHLLGLASNAGTALRLGNAVGSIDMTSRILSLASGEKLQFHFLIGADGVSSSVAKALFGRAFNPRTIGFGLEVEVPRQHMRDNTDRVEIDFAPAEWGYGWVFPKKKTFTVGVGGIHAKNADLRERLAHYLALKAVDAAGCRVKGQYIPFGDVRKTPGHGNVLLCGDATGAVDPITGEGIAYAMETGAAAGKAVVRASYDSGWAMDYYLEDYQRVAATIRQANVWRNLIFPKATRHAFAWAFSHAGTLRRGYMDILSGKHDYDALPKLFVQQARSVLRKSLVR